MTEQEPQNIDENIEHESQVEYAVDEDFDDEDEYDDEDEEWEVDDEDYEEECPTCNFLNTSCKFETKTNGIVAIPYSNISFVFENIGDEPYVQTKDGFKFPLKTNIISSFFQPCCSEVENTAETE